MRIRVVQQKNICHTSLAIAMSVSSACIHSFQLIFAANVAENLRFIHKMKLVMLKIKK